ncbi:unnamed protein product [Lactuca saligna]|uniref:Uncharacterized protein n=1 Tax=Lactuca saligna TaxID=75948 RepID=A0AA35VQD5_LACSI|nr:unnamed protein product [Lactuca saligna]
MTWRFTGSCWCRPECQDTSIFLSFRYQMKSLTTFSIFRMENLDGVAFILHSALLLHRKYSGNFLVDLLGKWKESEYSGQSVPVGGIAYYVIAPPSLADMAANPFHALLYLVFMLTPSALSLFSKTWIEVSGSCACARDVAKQLKEQQIVMLLRYNFGSNTAGSFSVMLHLGFGQPIKVNWAYVTVQREDTSGHYNIFVGDLNPEVTDATLYARFSVYSNCS